MQRRLSTFWRFITKLGGKLVIYKQVIKLFESLRRIKYLEKTVTTQSNLHEDIKVKLSPCFNWAPRHEGLLGEWRYSSTHFLTSAIDGGE
jgi:hypothetical protein